MVYVPWLYYTNRSIYLCEGTRRFILVHISQRTHSYSYSSYTILNLYTYWYLYLSQISRKSLQNLCLYRRTYIYLKSPVGVYRTYAYTEVPLGTTRMILIPQGLYLYYEDYTCLEVPVGTTEITERILVLRNLFLYGSTCKYYKTYTATSYLILVLRSISWSYGTYTSIIELIFVFQILYL